MAGIVIVPPPQDVTPSALSDADLLAFVNEGALPEPPVEGVDPQAAADPTPEAVQDAAGEAALDAAIGGEPAAGEEPQAADPAPEPTAAVRSFMAFDAAGNPIEEVPELLIETKIGGRTRREPLDKIVRMAQSGGYNETLQAEVREVRSLLPQVESERNAAIDYARRVEAKLNTVLADPDAWLAEVDAYTQANTPEARLQRTEAELDAIRQRENSISLQQTIAQTAEREILPRFASIVETSPHVTFEEVLGHFNTLIAPYRGPGGVIAPQFLPHVLAVVDQAVAPFAAQLHDAREEAAQAKANAATAADSASAVAKATTTAAAKAVQQARNAASRSLAPVGGPANPVAARQAPKPRAPRNANEAADNALDRALSDTFAQ